jgi:double-stranded uracil-DNA glycosylase
MASCVSFEAISREDARVLILGTLPGAESLRRQQYYAKKENSFWRIMGELIGAAPELPYKIAWTC